MRGKMGGQSSLGWITLRRVAGIGAGVSIPDLNGVGYELNWLVYTRNNSLSCIVNMHGTVFLPDNSYSTRRKRGDYIVLS